MNITIKAAVATLALFCSLNGTASTQKIDGLTIKSIRAVGNYHNADTFDDTVELWFSSSLNWSDDVSCSADYRVYIDADNAHMVSAAYMAFASDKKVSIFVDDSLPVRYGSCEISYLDVIK